MNTGRRTFLGAALAASVLPQREAAAEVKETVCTETCESTSAAKDPRTEFPTLILELCGKYSGEEDSPVITHLTSRRLVLVNLDDENDCGDLNTFWDGSSESWGLRNDEDGYWKIERAFEVQEPTMELHENKFPVSYEITSEELGNLLDKCIGSWT